MLVPVRAENPIRGCEQQSCGASGLAVMITDHVPAVRFPPDHADGRGAAAVQPRGDVEDRRDLLLHHQVTVLQRHQTRRPKLNWADRALLATLFGVMPKAQRHRLRLPVTPDTILRWRRGILQRRWAARSMRGRSSRLATGRNIKALVLRLAQETPNGDTAGSTVNWPAWECESRRRRCGRS